VAEVVLTEGVAALGASGGGLLLAAGDDRLNVPGTVGYDDTLVASLRSEPATAELPAAVALRTGEPVWLESEEERDARFSGLAGMERGTVSMCAVPLEGSGRVAGALRFSFSQRRLFDEDERRFVLALAALAAQALDRAQLYRDRLDVSARLQQGLLPPALPALVGVDMAAVYHPCGDGVEVGGDFYDVWPSGAGWLFALGDVCGTGPEAATMTALVRHSLRALTRLVSDQAAVLEHLNDILLQAGHDTSERFCTVIIGAITPGDDGVAVRLTTGGHPGPILRRGDGDVAELRADGSLLGVLPNIRLATLDLTLAGGDTLIFYTDGVTEARDGAGMFGIEGLLGSVERAPRPAAELVAALEADVLAHSGGVLRDDMAALVIRACPAS
jgi:serine phosphatase RsbU (regulator of sigma subunit)